MSVIKELIVDAYGCESSLSDAVALEKAARAAVEVVGARVAQSVCHPFQPHGLTICLVLQESHLVLSTWPEHAYAAVNVFLCDPTMDPRRVWGSIVSALRPTQVVFHEVPHDIRALPKTKAA